MRRWLLKCMYSGCAQGTPRRLYTSLARKVQKELTFFFLWVLPR